MKYENTKLTKLFLTEVLFCIMLMIAGLLFYNGRAYAITENIDGTIPKEITDDFYADTNCGGEGHAQYVWVSPPGGSGYNRIEIAEGQDSTGNLWLNTITGTCQKIIGPNGRITDTTLKTTRSRVTSAKTSRGTLKLIGDVTELNYNCSQFFDLRWVKICDQNNPFDPLSIYPSHNDFTITGLGGLAPGTYNVALEFQNRLVHRYQFPDREEFRCVARPPDGSLWYALELDGFRGFQNDPVVCLSVATKLTLTIVVNSVPKFDIALDIPVCNVDVGIVTFAFQNNGDGDSKYDGNNGVLSQYKVERIRNGVKTTLTDTLRSRVILAPGGRETFLYTIDPNQLKTGDKITSSLRVDPTKGKTGGAIIEGPITKSQSVECIYRAKPYFRVYGGDVVAGRSFESGGTCNASPGAPAKIQAYTKAVPGGSAGAGSQLAARATSEISDFLSAAMSTSNAAADRSLPPAGLSFGNTSTPAGFDTSAYQGCIKDYYAWASGTSPGQGNGQKLTASELKYTGKVNDKVIYYYEGDLTISKNIEFSPANNRQKLEDIPVFYLVVKGNINIDPRVTQLDGVYIAQPKADGSGGQINTCSTAPSTYQNCDEKLTVNGALIAKKVLFNRTNGELRTVSSPTEAADSNNIAEVINFTPEIYLINPSDIGPVEKNVGTYDSIVGLPPVF